MVEIAYWNISNVQVQRLKARPMDCVINALEVLNLINHMEADMIRIIIGNRGVQNDKIVTLFQYLFPSIETSTNIHVPIQWQWSNAYNLHTFITYINTIPDNTLTFCFVGHSKLPYTHAIVLGKINGDLYKFDEQSNYKICLLNDKHCFDEFSKWEYYHVLEYKR